VAQWPSPVMAVGQYLALCDRLQAAFPRLDLQFAPVNPDSCTEDLLLALRHEATRRCRRINIHLLETPYQKAYAAERWGQTCVEWLAKSGFLGPDVICAHCVWVTERDVELMRATGAVVAHNPSSNLRLRSGLAPVRRMAECRLPIALGTDNLGMNDDEDMLQEARLAQLLHSPPGLDQPPISAEEVLGWATEHAAHLLGVSKLGRLEAGSPADLVLARLDGIARWIDGSESVAAAVIQWLRRDAVDMVVVGGNVVVRAGRYIHRDRDEIERAAHEGVR
jgi:5-methylthioadenosine/S-adenosylhomocysteine deaminase